MERYLLNEQIVPKEKALIHLEDRGYHFGDGIYEVVRVYHGQPFALVDHLTRFKNSAKKLDIPIPFEMEKLEALIRQLIEANSVNQGTVYFQLTRGISPRNHLYNRTEVPVLTGYARPHPTNNHSVDSVDVWLTDDIRWLRCDIKSINLLGNVLAKREASDHNCHEALLHRDGTVTEGSSSNLFLVSNDTLYTHPATNLILNGITRQLVMKLANQLDLSVIEEPFPKEVLKEADEAFITSTTMEVMPIRTIQGAEQATFNIGPVTKKLQQAFNEEITRQCHTATKQ
ncbi:D-amino-acid transaminase [Halalkalibacterium ligniniphilum]|uniref:D-amino-acid transaminase n=2 Tax=Halalkalibacterium ligniniphilum TaxID=1134413 RepID=UPI000347653F|nr:D-amino-acid transaminase [Halalkalibacterium ligniniphilum]